MSDEPLAESVKDEVVATSAAEAPKFIELSTGNALSNAETEAITLRWPTQLIVLAGAEGSGKTTMLSSVYERLSQAPFAGFQFAGSQSLLGFEQICHANRLSSGGTCPATLRTIPADESSYYHLYLREDSGDRRRRHVLLSALSGELYRWARNSREECKKLVFLHRADTIVILIDGARLVASDQRTNAYADAAGILGSFLDAKMVSPGCRVEFVFSKLDCILKAGAPALAFLTQTQNKLDAKFRDQVPGLTFRQIAARPDLSSNSEDFSDGLAEAFTSWTSLKPVTALDNWCISQPPIEAREFSKFGWRQFQQNREEKS